MSIYDELKPIAAELLKEFKQGVIKLKNIVVSGSADAPTNTETVYELDATVRGVTSEFLKDSFITSSDLIVTAAVVEGVTPSMNDLIEIDGVNYKIVKDMSLPAAGTKVVWKFIVRKGG
jgi:hypothetical protein